MSKYIFRDTITGWDEYDITGDDYARLISTCCKYSAYLSLRITGNEISGAKELERFAVPKNENFVYMYDHFYRENSIQCNLEVKYYRVCPELCDLLLRISDSIFKWIDGWGHTNPEDPVFYRADGSVFFSSVIHNGECFLYPNDGEDISEIIANDNWVEMKENSKLSRSSAFPKSPHRPC